MHYIQTCCSSHFCQDFSKVNFLYLCQFPFRKLSMLVGNFVSYPLKCQLTHILAFPLSPVSCLLLVTFICFPCKQCVTGHPPPTWHRQLPSYTHYKPTHTPTHILSISVPLSVVCNALLFVELINLRVLQNPFVCQLTIGSYPMP